MATWNADHPAEWNENIVLRRTGNANPFPHLDPAALEQLKGAPLLDLNRFLWSPVSEDWITWNAFHLLQLKRPEDWWQALGLAEAPQLSYWQQPVELVLSSTTALIFVETRLRHDASAETLNRKLMELKSAADGRKAEYWFFLKAAETPRELLRWLDSKPAGVDVRTLRWADVLGTVWDRHPDDDAVLAGVKKELRRRTGADVRIQPTADAVQRGVLNSRRRSA